MTRREFAEITCFVLVAALVAYAGAYARNFAFDPDGAAAMTDKADAKGADKNVAGSELRTMSFNIRYGAADDGPNSWKYRRELVFDTIRQSKADVIGVQEALHFQLDEIREALPFYGQTGVGRDDGKRKGEYSAILYDTRRFELVEGSTFWLSDTPEVVGSNTWAAACTRICTWVHLVEKKTGRAVWIFNTHFDHISARARERSARLIARKIKELAGGDEFVMMGDLNAAEGSREIKYFKAKANVDGEGPAVEMVDTFRQINPDAAEVGTFGGFEGVTNGAKIDYIFVSADTKVLKADIWRYNDEGRYPSDHYPVTATVVIQ